MKTLFILNDPPYGTERSYNALRLAGQLVKQEESEVKLFYIGDAASCAKRGQTTPNGFYNIERMTKGVVAKGADVGVCGSSMDELTEWTIWADKVIVF